MKMQDDCKFLTKLQKKFEARPEKFWKNSTAERKFRKKF